MGNIFIYGVPGSGKTSIAKTLQATKGYTYLELDEVRAQAQAGKTEQDDPFLFEYTTTAWKRFGEMNADNSIKGLLAIRQALQPAVLKEITQHTEPIIAEAAFLDPKIMQDYGSCYLVTSPSEKDHYSRFFIHRTPSPETDQQFMAARMINRFLLSEAAPLGVRVINNSSSIDAATNLVIKSAQT